MLKAEIIHEKISENKYFYSRHGDEERQNDNLTIKEIEEAILNCRIIEYYKDDKRGKSCLVAGFTNNGKPIHAIIGERGDFLVIITVYIPTPPKFKTLYERG